MSNDDGQGAIPTGKLNETPEAWIERITTDPEVKNQIREKLRKLMTDEEAERFMAEEIPTGFAEFKRKLESEAAASRLRRRG